MQKVFTAQQQKFTLAVTEIGYNNSLPFENVWYKYSFSGPDGVISQDNDFYAPLMYSPKQVIDCITACVLTIRPCDANSDTEKAFLRSPACDELKKQNGY